MTPKRPIAVRPGLDRRRSLIRPDTSNPARGEQDDEHAAALWLYVWSHDALRPTGGCSPRRLSSALPPSTGQHENEAAAAAEKAQALIADPLIDCAHRPASCWRWPIRRTYGPSGTVGGIVKLYRYLEAQLVVISATRHRCAPGATRARAHVAQLVSARLRYGIELAAVAASDQHQRPAVLAALGGLRATRGRPDRAAPRRVDGCSMRANVQDRAAFGRVAALS